MQTKLLTKCNIATVGEEITHELGAELVNNYRNAHPNDVKAYVIGKEILGQILLSWHNIAFFQALMIRMRAAIADGTFQTLRRDLLTRWTQT